MVCKEFGIITSVLVAGLVYTFYTPLPDDAIEPWKQLIARSYFRMGYIGANFAEVFGYDRINFTRLLSDGSSKIPYDESIHVIDTKFNGVNVRIYKPKDAKNSGPGLIYIHGGGWALGTIALYDPLVRRISKLSGFVTVSIGYRRAPEHPFPIPFDDCLAATLHFMKNSKHYDVDPARIAIVGDSAGGNLAAAVILKLSTDKSTNLRPVLQTLIYPALQALDFDLPSYRSYNDIHGPFLLNKPLMVKYWLNYGCGKLDYLAQFLENNHISPDIMESNYFSYVDRKNLIAKYLTEADKYPLPYTGNKTVFAHVSDWLLNPYFAPLMASDSSIRMLPPTYIVTAEYDPLRDDGFLFAKRLQSLNLDVIHTHYDGLNHGFISFDFLESSTNAITEMVQYWNSQMFDEEELLKTYRKS